MRLICEVSAPFVANSAVDAKPVARPLRRHTDGCLKCQARHVAMTRTARELMAMSADTYVVPMDLEWRVMSSLDGDLAVARSWKTPVTLLAAGASMAAAILIWRLRPRPQT
jgi:hypothetical protein